MAFRTLGIHNDKITIEDYFEWINKYKVKEIQVEKEKRLARHEKECINERRRKKGTTYYVLIKGIYYGSKSSLLEAIKLRDEIFELL